MLVFTFVSVAHTQAWSVHDDVIEQTEIASDQPDLTVQHHSSTNEQCRAFDVTVSRFPTSPQASEPVIWSSIWRRGVELPGLDKLAVALFRPPKALPSQV